MGIWRLWTVVGFSAATIFARGAFAVPAAGQRPVTHEAGKKPKAQAELQALLARVQRTYARRSYTARFTQTYVDSSTGARPSETGQLQVSATGKVRFAYAAPENKLFVFDGNTAFFAEPEAAQVTQVANFGQGPAGEALAFLWGGGAGVGAFAAEACATDCPPTGKGERAVTFRPKKPMAAVARLDLVVAQVGPNQAEVAAVRVQDALGNQTRYLLQERTFDAVLDPNGFAYVPPKDFSVVQALAE